MYYHDVARRYFLEVRQSEELQMVRLDVQSEGFVFQAVYVVMELRTDMNYVPNMNYVPI